MTIQANINAHDPNLAIICGNYPFGSGTFTNVNGGVMTVVHHTNGGSSLISWSPAMISAPVIVGTFQNADSSKTANIAFIHFTGVTVSNAYLVIGNVAGILSEATVGIIIVGQAKL